MWNINNNNNNNKKQILYCRLPLFETLEFNLVTLLRNPFMDAYGRQLILQLNAFNSPIQKMCSMKKAQTLCILLHV